MSHSNGRIYIDRTVTPNIGVNTFDVSYVLGVSSDDVGTLCTSININKWAKYKPVRFNAPGIISDANRETAHHGFVVSPGSANSIFEYSLQDLFDRYDANNGEYEYIRPNAWYRILDFVPPSLSGNGYNHAAPAPFIYNNPSSASSYVTNYTLAVTLNSDAGAELTVADIIRDNAYQVDMSRYYICLACEYVKNNQTYHKISRAITTDGHNTPRTLAAFVKGESLFASMELDGYRDYKLMWIATEIDPSSPDEPGACVYLPLGGFVFRLNQGVLTINYTFSWSGSAPSAHTEYEYDQYGNYVPCCGINFGSSFSRVTMAEVAPEQRTATIYATPLIHLRNGGVVPGDKLTLTSIGDVSVNTTSQQIIDTTLVGKVMCTVDGEYIAASDVSHIELITEVEIVPGGQYNMSLANSNGTQRDNIYF